MSATPPTDLVQATTTHAPRVEGREGGAIGEVYAYLIDKQGGRATYAVLSLGGFMGMGRSFYPVPFRLLTYDGVRDVYVASVDKKLLEGGPSWANNAPLFDRAYADRVSSYYGQSADAGSF